MPNVPAKSAGIVHHSFSPQQGVAATPLTVLSWRLSNTMEADFCVAALEEAMARYGKPDIFNTDQGSQCTSFAFTNSLRDASIRISMDGRGRWMDNVFIERIWRSLKYECVFHSFPALGTEAENSSSK